MEKGKNYLVNFSLSVFGLLLALIIVEVLLRIFSPHQQFSSLYPNMSFDYHHEINIFPNTEDRYQVTTNEFGYRASSYFDKNKFGILSIGGSTTACLMLSDDNTWSSLLEDKLNAFSSKSNNIIVGNIGSSGLNSGHHVLQMKHLVPQKHYENVKIILMLVGVNDYLRFLGMGDTYFPTWEDPKLFRRSFIQYPRTEPDTWYMRTELYLLLRDIKNKWNKNKNSTFGDALQKKLRNIMKQYEDTPKKDTLPDFSIALKDYETNLIKIIQLAKTQNRRLIFLTQPVFWHEDIKGKEANLASLGAPIIDGYTYTPKAFAKGMDLFNERLKETAIKHQAEYIDIAKTLPKDSTVFIDHCHFNLPGSDQLSDLIFDYLKTSTDF